MFNYFKYYNRFSEVFNDEKINSYSNIFPDVQKIFTTIQDDLEKIFFDDSNRNMLIHANILTPPLPLNIVKNILKQSKRFDVDYNNVLALFYFKFLLFGRDSILFTNNELIIKINSSFSPVFSCEYLLIDDVVFIEEPSAKKMMLLLIKPTLRPVFILWHAAPVQFFVYLFLKVLILLKKKNIILFPIPIKSPPSS